MKDLIFKALNHETFERAPWVPFAGVHAASITGHTATEMLTNADIAYEALMEVNRLYKPDGQPVIFDLQIEAEILGCGLVWADDCPPSVSSHPLETEDEEPPVIPDDSTLPKKTDGRLPYVIEVMERMKKSVGDTTALYGLICGPFTLASHLRGNQIFTDMYDYEDEIIALMDYCTKVCNKVAEYYIEAGMDVVAMVDPLISQISVDNFEVYCSDAYTKVFDFIRSKGAYSSFFVCGDATRNIEVMCKTKPDSISVDENVDIIAAYEIAQKYNVCVGGNIPLTTTMLMGNQQDNMKGVVELIDKFPEMKNFIIAPGCDMPFSVPVENAIGAAQACIETDSVREMVKNYQAEDIDTSGVVVPDYANLKKPLIEVFTLDSAQCAACGYMMNAANDAVAAFGDQIDVIEYKYIYKENVARCVKMGVPNLPSMYINGELKYKSIIPSREELDAAIKEAIASIK